MMVYYLKRVFCNGFFLNYKYYYGFEMIFEFLVERLFLIVKWCDNL